MYDICIGKKKERRKNNRYKMQIYIIAGRANVMCIAQPSYAVKELAELRRI